VGRDSRGLFAVSSDDRIPRCWVDGTRVWGVGGSTQQTKFGAPGRARETVGLHEEGEQLALGSPRPPDRSSAGPVAIRGFGTRRCYAYTIDTTRGRCGVRFTGVDV